MPTIKVTKLYNILKERKMSQKDLFDAIPLANKGEGLSQYIISEIVSGKRVNFHIRTAILIANTLNLPIDDIID